MAKKAGVLIISLMAFQLPPAWAVAHIVQGAYPNAFQDMIHHPTAAQVRAAGSAQAASIASASGTKNVAVILVQFTLGNASLISGSHSIQSASAVKSYFDQMKSYYSEISYGKITLNFMFFNSDTATPNGDPIPSLNQTGAYTLPHPEEYYGCGDEGQGSIPPCSGVLPSPPTLSANGNYLARDAIVAARSGPNAHLGLVSTDNGGIFDAIIIIHAGNGNETTQRRNGDIWSIFYSQDPDIIGGQSGADSQPQAVLAGFEEADVDPETETSSITSPLGVMCHEFGHSLGLPDLYNTSVVGGTSVVGKWEIMDAGPYLSGGTNPAHMCAWDKMTLGWVTPVVGGATRFNATLALVETNPSLLKIPVQNGLPQEYFLIEYRSRNSGALFDRSIPGDGLLIWHVDDAITSSRGINAPLGKQNTVNSGSPHYGVSLVTANGVSVASDGGDAGNAFTNGRNFTSPFSDNFGAQPSGISLVNISGVGSNTVSAQVANLAVAAGQSILKVINYPNPAGAAYEHSHGAGHTTIQMQLTRPANDFQMNIYTLSGDLVRKVGSDEISLDLDRSSDAKWVYEFVWDLKNGDGAMVAPGVYLYLARADGQAKSGKAVIIR